MEDIIKKKLVFIITAFIFFVGGVTCLVLSFTKPGNNIYLILALAFTFTANLIIVLANVLIRPKTIKKD